mmetsp:Transcript_7247/g.23198  ORF Transcript_7247/g.23198 Transcript_7247/m.23198 type:complete len:206 (-) Transcript_7247:146-763(-)
MTTDATRRTSSSLMPASRLRSRSASGMSGHRSASLFRCSATLQLVPHTLSHRSSSCDIRGNSAASTTTTSTRSSALAASLATSSVRIELMSRLTRVATAGHTIASRDASRGGEANTMLPSTRRSIASEGDSSASPTRAAPPAGGIPRCCTACRSCSVPNVDTTSQKTFSPRFLARSASLPAAGYVYTACASLSTSIPLVPTWLQQ